MMHYYKELSINLYMTVIRVPFTSKSKVIILMKFTNCCQTTHVICMEDFLHSVSLKTSQKWKHACYQKWHQNLSKPSPSVSRQREKSSLVKTPVVRLLLLRFHISSQCSAFC